MLASLVDEPNLEELAFLQTEAADDPLATELLARQRDDGSWSEPPAARAGAGTGDRVAV